MTISRATGPSSQATAAEIRAWAVSEGLEIAAKGRIPAQVRAAFEASRNTPADG
ncbi:Lsr2 dimerization domain-containing protein [Euzebya tangerina]|uniref:Lsr2 family DNA-binding protein n=1 Tax=Euzebya tangerina TaxID=591198 RepID=UPI00196A4AB1|nr:histone-like nucleoid-structuring protein Lsr2 [Euzebya tangerina]